MGKIALRDVAPSAKSRAFQRGWIEPLRQFSVQRRKLSRGRTQPRPKLSESVAFHGDVRMTRALDHVSVWNLPLKPWTSRSRRVGIQTAKNSSFNLQIDGAPLRIGPPYPPRLRQRAGDITLGFGHRWAVTSQLARENANLPFKVRLNTVRLSHSIQSLYPHERASNALPINLSSAAGDDMP